MPAIALEHFPHIPGVHSSSSAISDVLRHDGQTFSEAMVFGLGAGLGFFYFDSERYFPTLRFNGRADDLEGKFYRLQGTPLNWFGKWDADNIEKIVGAGRPLFAQTDSYHLPYHAEPNADKELQQVHFPLNGVVITAISLADHRVTLADSFSPELQTISLDDLHAAVEGIGSPMCRPFRLAEAPLVELSITEELLAQAIRTMVEEMFNPNRPELGLPALRKLANGFRNWPESRADWRFAARFAAQGIDARGSGGGAFRLIYADFLHEAARWIPALKTLEAEHRARESAALWSNTAQHCQRAFAENSPADLAAAGQLVARIARLEEELMRDLSDTVRPLL